VHFGDELLTFGTDVGAYGNRQAISDDFVAAESSD